MKKLIAVALFLCMSGCAGQEWSKHNSLYESWDHARFSITGYKHPTERDSIRTKSEGWWGKTVEMSYQK